MFTSYLPVKPPMDCCNSTMQLKMIWKFKCPLLSPEPLSKSFPAAADVPENRCYIHDYKTVEVVSSEKNFFLLINVSESRPSVDKFLHDIVTWSVSECMRKSSELNLNI
jgi:hypothetical protein